MPLPHPIDLAYLLGLAAASPYWLLAPKPRAKVLSALRDRRAKLLPPRPQTKGPTVLIHAVSLGEINATRTLVADLLARRADLTVVVSATTAAGHARALELYSTTPRLAVARYPLDLSAAVARFLDHYRPDVVVLMELELWPNFLRLCRKRRIPALLVNGRLTRHSMVRYRWIAPLARRMFRSLSAVCVQDDTYRDRFIAVGADPATVAVTGTMKFDTAQLTTDPVKVAELRTTLALDPAAPLLLAASTGPGEEALALSTYRALLPTHPTLRLAIVPRQPARFDEVANLIRSQGFPLRRRTNPTEISPPTHAGSEIPNPKLQTSNKPQLPNPNNIQSTAAPALSPQSAIRNPQSAITPPPTPAPVLLGDTLGELRTFYALATLAFVGRSLVDLGPKQHGSDMIEPAALGVPVLVGPHTGNFADAMHLFRAHHAVVELHSPEDLTRESARLLADPQARTALATAATTTVQKGQGATAKHTARILSFLPPPKT